MYFKTLLGYLSVVTSNDLRVVVAGTFSAVQLRWGWGICEGA